VPAQIPIPLRSPELPELPEPQCASGSPAEQAASGPGGSSHELHRPEISWALLRDQ
jgi:hypothetical protein